MAVLAFAGTVLADSIAADGDVASGPQNVIDLETVAPGATITRNVTMTLFCSGLRHVDPGQVVTLSQAGVTVPAAGGSVSATSTTVGPVPAGWANDTAGIAGCAGPMSIDSATPSVVTIVAPTTPGLDYLFSVTYGRTLTPVGVSDGSSVTGFTIVTFSLDVEDADTTAPVLAGMPGDLALVTSDPGGVVLDYPLPTATDDRDPAPTVVCDPAPGEVASVGTTFVVCTATDAAGNTSSASFTATVHLASVIWEAPIQAGGASVTRGRSLPVKARAELDGVPLRGPASLEVWSCAARSTGPVHTAATDWQTDPERWMAVLDTSGLAVGCHVVTLVRDGLALGSFGLDVVEPPVPQASSSRGNRANRAD
ncbi:MAG TPA: HYR domain-containing protein [Candidatus Limnocylindrales bacterium]|nr:HYR domain-containing protein [Candidatus Limnocylindrales bacterium]